MTSIHDNWSSRASW